MNNDLTMKKPPYGMIAILFVGAFVAFLNNTLLNVALPTIMKDFGITYAKVQWLATGYMLVSGILVPASAFFVTRFKNRHLFITAMSIFTIGTIMAGFAPNFGMLLAGRMVQAAGAASMSPLLMNVMLTSFPKEKRGAAMGIFGLVMIAAPAIGPTLSGYIVEHHDWRMLFQMIIPFAIISLLFGIWKLDNVMETREVHLDVPSVLLSTVAFGGILYGFSTAGDKGWSSPWVYGTIIVGFAALIIFIFKQLRMDQPLLELRIYKYPMFALSSAISVIVSMAMFSGMILTPAYVQSIRGIEPFEAGLMMLPGALAMGIMSPITGKLFDKFGPRILAIIGLTITTMATFGLTKLAMDSSYTFIVSMYTIRMFGMSMVMMPIMTNGLNQLPQMMNPHGTAINNTLQQVAGAIGSAVLVTFMNNRTKSTAEDLIAEAKAHAAQSGVAPTAEQMQQMKEQIMQTALLDGITHSFLIATFVTVLALILAFFLKRVKVESAAATMDLKKPTN
ncbi:DHA2 family efflux MFS transporter permease subunit [Lysinibacillus sphaericus]|uniref:EmrB/QacA subfamily drug resistance transporter n=1 Tax=Lysinibacillus sphaericus TaxID=1421 RepID=A0A2S0K5S2_LYSSH|nr:DHA2 family efflux MFS transporter permease subunit [Lysinibacillus sphaericus]AVK98723.1 MFS transporter [Lysinibacillus sphaericus]MED4544360.1 DHA2 family efflux MFS transporter permease subunit [Lysinibacillus sphaericus]TKI21341.1 DHA2 family efflux MFS transporter permease subunit [Lysinibacillus sphaericus]SUV15281.1 EmrB/QacA subfamily drug resistance transporter [Lysinibacillus sphaericus]GEC83236.1 MFS transporter [Lysinibacillus sphaericus]